jgi:hypothetical protein
LDRLFEIERLIHLANGNPFFGAHSAWNPTSSLELNLELDLENPFKKLTFSSLVTFWKMGKKCRYVFLNGL